MHVNRDPCRLANHQFMLVQGQIWSNYVLYKLYVKQRHMAVGRQGCAGLLFVLALYCLSADHCPRTELG